LTIAEIDYPDFKREQINRFAAMMILIMHLFKIQPAMRLIS